MLFRSYSCIFMELEKTMRVQVITLLLKDINTFPLLSTAYLDPGLLLNLVATHWHQNQRSKSIHKEKDWYQLKGGQQIPENGQYQILEDHLPVKSTATKLQFWKKNIKTKQVLNYGLTVSCKNRRHLSNLNCTSSAIKKWSKPLAKGVATTKAPLNH